MWKNAYTGRITLAVPVHVIMEHLVKTIAIGQEL
jgi:hypothetical protein